MVIKTLALLALLLATSFAAEPCFSRTSIFHHEKIPRGKSRTRTTLCPTGHVLVDHDCTHTNTRHFFLKDSSVVKSDDGVPIGVTCTMKRKGRAVRRSAHFFVKAICVDAGLFNQGIRPTSQCARVEATQKHDNVKTFVAAQTNAICDEGLKKVSQQCVRSSSKFDLLTKDLGPNGVNCQAVHTSQIGAFKQKFDVTVRAGVRC